MAIQDSFDINKALVSQAYAYKCWYNYEHGGNTMQIDNDSYNRILDTWKGQLSHWREVASNDENVYRIDDNDFNTAKLEGKQDAKKDTGFDGKADNNDFNSAVNIVGAGGGAVMGILTTLTSTLNAWKDKYISSPWVSAVIGGILLANAIHLKSANPNKEAADACQTGTTEILPEAQSEIDEQSMLMEGYNDDIEYFATEAEATNEETNEELKKTKAKYEVYQKTYDILMQKMESGTPLTKEEKDLLKSLVPIMFELGLNASDLQESSNEDVKAIYDEIGGYIEGYDAAAEKVGEIDGKLEFFANFDEQTETNASRVKDTSILAAAGSAGVLASGIQGAATAGLNVGQYIASGIAIATGTASGILFGKIAQEQNQYKNMAEMEIEARKVTEDMNSNLLSEYEENISNFDAHMTEVSELELTVPEGIPADKEEAEGMAEELQTEVQTATSGTQPAASGTAEKSGNNSQDKDKDKDKQK